MALMILGIALWWAGHLYKRIQPAGRAQLQERMGEASKGIFAAILALSVVLMVVGYRAAEPGYAFTPPGWGIHLNNLLMLVAIALMGLGNSKSRLRGKLRHPMLLGFLIWCIAHLLVNGNTEAVVLFAGLALWVPVEIALINRAEPEWERWEGGSLAGDLRLGVITVVVMGVIALIHTWLGYWPFPG